MTLFQPNNVKERRLKKSKTFYPNFSFVSQPHCCSMETVVLSRRNPKMAYKKEKIYSFIMMFTCAPQRLVPFSSPISEREFSMLKLVSRLLGFLFQNVNVLRFMTLYFCSPFSFFFFGGGGTSLKTG